MTVGWIVLLVGTVLVGILARWLYLTADPNEGETFERRPFDDDHL